MMLCGVQTEIYGRVFVMTTLILARTLSYGNIARPSEYM